MATYRVGSWGVRIINPDGGGYSLPPGAVLDELPNQYEGTLREIQEDGTSKAVHTYADKMIRPAENKATPARRPDPRLSNCVLEGGRSKTYPPAEDKSL